MTSGAAPTSHIRTAAVLGAGTMGAQIAAHLANAGIPTLLLDVTDQAARDGLARAAALTPAPFFTPDTRALVTTGSFADGLPAAAGCDWVIEAIVERLELKQALLADLDRHRAPHTIVSTNTSGLPIASVVAGRSPGFRAHALGTHFFNPPRYLRLLEIIPTQDTDKAIVDTIVAFADRRLGKGTVIAKDTPNFIANRLGLFGVIRTLRVLAGSAHSIEAGAHGIETIDAITGPAIGRPKSATFRTIDLAGIDLLAQVSRNLAERLPEPADREAFALPPIVAELESRGWIGAKAGQGFYRKEPDGEIRVLDPATLTYRPKQPARFASIEAARAIDDTGARIRTLFLGDDAVGAFLRDTLGATLVYAARIAPSIAFSEDDVDRAMCWGFGWELGPFETWDAIGVAAVVEACGVTDPPPLVREALERGGFRTPTAERKAARVPPAGAGLQLLRGAKERTAVLRRNAGASLVDLGDGVLGVEFHSKMNAIGGDTIEMLHAALAEARASFRALVVGNDAPHFSAGANLMLLLLEAQEENWDEIDLMVRAFQDATMALKHAAVPVVVAPGGLALGGGCEIVLHGDRVQAAAESYLGLVEAGVGLIPAGGGTKEMLARAMEAATVIDAPRAVQQVFETIGFAKVSTSAAHARRLGYLRDADEISMNRERLIADAKRLALSRADGFRPAHERRAIPVGGAGLLATLKLGIHLALRAERISDHDARIGRALARVLAGGDRPHPGLATERELLDLEREAFLSLCGERLTQERIAHTLKTGQTLRN